MNERIKELAAGAGIYGAVDINGNYENEAEVKKFAELIVKECADYLDAYNKAIIGEVSIVGVRLKQHFGVEE